MTARRLLALCLGAALCGAQMGCAGLVSHDRQQAGVSLRTMAEDLAQQNAADPERPVGDPILKAPDGLYALRLNLVIGDFTTVVAADPTADGFRANSRPNAAPELIGGLKGALVAWLAGDRLKGGAIIRWESAVDPESGAWFGEMSTPLLTLGATRLPGESRVRLFEPDGRLTGYATLEPIEPGEHPRSDLSAVVNALDETLSTYLYDRRLADRRSIRVAINRARELTEIAEDDLEFAFGVFAAFQGLPISPVHLFRRPDEAVVNAAAGEPEPPLVLHIEDDLVTLRVTGSWSVTNSHIRRAFEEIDAAQPHGLVLDLRRATSGAFALMHIASHLLDQECDAGLLVGATKRDAALAGEFSDLPAPDDLSSLELLREMLNEYGGLRGHIETTEPRFEGPVVILTSRRTSYAGEALAELLHRANRATIIGERTAGLTVVPDLFDLGQDWVLQLPAYEYITADGARLDGEGVQPDIEIEDRDEQIRVARWTIRHGGNEQTEGEPRP